MGLGSLVAMFATMMLVLVLIFIALYVYSALALMAIANKTKTKNAWLAWIPIANVYLMTQMAEVSPWFTLAILLPFVPVIGAIAMIVIMVWLWWKIAEEIGKPGWWGILTIIPIVNLVIIGIMAWGK
ncbi:hypothetical protein COS75_01220 [Candidatus Pacearchaeota archaeon CG06_land_8_20_14_3_00_35_12]|nr:MAG: hypothetical protein COS75_01220 [Candidatus Pacearchaeota archaeon CG06_land_8_20_14_3_00_35_12]